MLLAASVAVAVNVTWAWMRAQAGGFESWQGLLCCGLRVCEY